MADWDGRSSRPVRFALGDVLTMDFPDEFDAVVRRFQFMQLRARLTPAR